MGDEDKRVVANAMESLDRNMPQALPMLLAKLNEYTQLSNDLDHAREEFKLQEDRDFRSGGILTKGKLMRFKDLIERNFDLSKQGLEKLPQDIQNTVQNYASALANYRKASAHYLIYINIMRLIGQKPEFGSQQNAVVSTLVNILGTSNYCSDAVTEQALEVLAKFGEAIKPQLIAVLKQNEQSNSKQIENQKGNVLMLLKNPCFKPEQSIPIFIGFLNDHWLKQDPAIDALISIGKGALPALYDAFSNSRYSKERLNIAKIIRAISPTEDGLPILISALSDPDEVVSSNILDIISDLGEVAIPSLVQSLNQDSILVRENAIWVLSKIKVDASGILPHLIKALADPEYLVQNCAVKAIGKLGSAAKTAVPQLLEALKKEPKLQNSGDESLRNIGKIPESIGPICSLS